MADFKDFIFSTPDLEANEELEFVAWAESNGWEIRKIQYVGRRSCPDRLCVGYGVKELVELKRPSARKMKRGGLSAGQELEFERFSKVGVEVKICYTAAEAIAYLKGFMPDES